MVVTELLFSSSFPGLQDGRLVEKHWMPESTSLFSCCSAITTFVMNSIVFSTVNWKWLFRSFLQWRKTNLEIQKQFLNYQQLVDHSNTRMRTKVELVWLKMSWEQKIGRELWQFSRNFKSSRTLFFFHKLGISIVWQKRFFKSNWSIHKKVTDL